MANTLTNLAADIYKAADMVGREAVGFVSSGVINGGTERAAKGDTVRAAFTRAQTVNTTFAPAMTIPEGTDQTVDNKTVVLNSYASIQIPWTGEDQKHLDNGAGFETVYGDQFRQAFRSIVNKIELDGWNEARKNASRAYGTAGTTPFGSNFNELPQLQKILVDNGMPFGDGQLSLVMDTTAAANLMSLSALQKVNEAGSNELLRQGALGELMGFILKRSGQVGLHTKGTGASYQFNGAGAVGDTSINLDTGTGTIVAGDILTAANGTPADTNKYVVNTALSGGVAVIGGPGLRSSHVDNDAVTVGNNYTANVALHRNALELAIRPPAEPQGGDAADDKMIVQDPHSGLVFEVAAYKGYMKRMIEIRALYQWKAWKSDAIVLLLG
jgi:hypothetical protein